MYIHKQLKNIISGVGTSPNPCSETYPGPGAFSEPEVREVAEFLSVNDVVLYMAYHNCGQFYLTPYGYTFDEAPDYDELVREHVFWFFPFCNRTCD